MCSAIVVMTKDSMTAQNQDATVRRMSQGSSWNHVDRYGESLHSSEVTNARELKFCEGCGALLVRLRGSRTQFCRDCKPPLLTVKETLQ